MSEMKNVIKEKMEKGKEWIKENRGTIGYLAGLAVATAGYLVVEKVFEPKKVAICFGRNENNPDQAIGQVWWKDRFGKEYHFANIDYGQGDISAELKYMCDDLNEIVYPGD